MLHVKRPSTHARSLEPEWSEFGEVVAAASQASTTLEPHFVDSQMQAMSDPGWPGVGDRQYSRTLVPERSRAILRLVSFAQLPMLPGGSACISLAP